MSEITVGRIAFERTAPRIIRVVKAKDRVKSDDDYMHEHNIAMLKLLVRNPRYRQIAVEEVRKVALDGVK